MPEGIRMRQQEPSNAKSVQFMELHAFACDLVCIYLSVLFDFLIVHILDIVITGTRVGAAVG